MYCGSISDFIYTPSETERFLSSTGLPEAGRGYHTLYEKAFCLSSGHHIVVAYLVGGTNNGARATVVLCKKDNECITYGIHAGGFRLPIPCCSEEDVTTVLRKATTGLPRTDNLAWVETLPGFNRQRWGETEVRHRDGWFTRSILAIPMLPTLIPFIFRTEKETQAWKIREGVYFAFPDGTYRLVSYSEFYPKDEEGYPITPWWETFDPATPVWRQGDCLVIQDNVPPNLPVADLTLPLRLGRHEVYCDNITTVAETRDVYWIRTDGEIRLYHPEHGELRVPASPGSAYCVALLPGTSRPFQRDGDAD